MTTEFRYGVVLLASCLALAGCGPGSPSASTTSPGIARCTAPVPDSHCGRSFMVTNVDGPIVDVTISGGKSLTVYCGQATYWGYLPLTPLRVRVTKHATAAVMFDDAAEGTAVNVVIRSDDVYLSDAAAISGSPSQKCRPENMAPTPSPEPSSSPIPTPPFAAGTPVP